MGNGKRIADSNQRSARIPAVRAAVRYRKGCRRGDRLDSIAGWGISYCQRNNLSASAKLIRAHTSIIAIADQLAASEAPSFITDLSESFKAVRGRTLMAGCKNAGNLDAEKKMPQRSHIGSMTRFINPDTPSIIFGLDATSNPMPAKVSAPIRATAARSTMRPWTDTPKAIHAKATTAATSITRKASRENMYESR